MPAPQPTISTYAATENGQPRICIAMTAPLIAEAGESLFPYLVVSPEYARDLAMGLLESADLAEKLAGEEACSNG